MKPAIFSELIMMFVKDNRVINLLFVIIFGVFNIFSFAKEVGDTESAYDERIKAGEHENAKQILLANRNIFPDFADKAINVARLLEKEGQCSDASELYRESLRYKPLSYTTEQQRSLVDDGLHRCCLATRALDICEGWFRRFQGIASNKQQQALKRVVEDLIRPYPTDPLGYSFLAGWVDLAAELDPEAFSGAVTKKKAIDHYLLLRSSAPQVDLSEVQAALETLKSSDGSAGERIYDRETEGLRRMRDYQAYLDDPFGQRLPDDRNELASVLQPDLIRQAELKREAFNRFQIAKRDHLRTRSQDVRTALEQVKPKTGTRGHATYKQELANCWAEYCQVKNTREILNEWSSRLAHSGADRPHLLKVERQLEDCLSRQANASRKETLDGTTEQGIEEGGARRVPRSSPAANSGLPEACTALPREGEITRNTVQAFRMMNGELIFDGNYIERVLADLRSVDQSCRSELWIALGDFRYTKNSSDKARELHSWSNAILNYHKAILEMRDRAWLERACKRVIPKVCEAGRVLTSHAGYSNSEFRIDEIRHICAEAEIFCGGSELIAPPLPIHQRSTETKDVYLADMSQLSWFTMFLGTFLDSPVKETQAGGLSKAKSIVGALRHLGDVGYAARKMIRSRLSDLGVQSGSTYESLYHFIISIRAVELQRYGLASYAMDNIKIQSLHQEEVVVVHEVCRTFKIESDVCKWRQSIDQLEPPPAPCAILAAGNLLVGPRLTVRPLGMSGRHRTC